MRRVSFDHLALFLGIALGIGLFASAASGQSQRPARAAPVKAETIKLTLKPDPDMPQGKVVVLSGVVNEIGVAFLLEDLSILQPVAVMLAATDASHDLQLQLSKAGMNAPAREGSTKGEGMSRFCFRTQGALRIFVRSNEPRPLPFYLLAWAGDEEAVKMDDVVVPTGQANTRVPSGGRR